MCHSTNLIRGIKLFLLYIEEIKLFYDLIYFSVSKINKDENKNGSIFYVFLFLEYSIHSYLLSQLTIASKWRHN